MIIYLNLKKDKYLKIKDEKEIEDFIKLRKKNSKKEKIKYNKKIKKNNFNFLCYRN